jgi:hypothetical protein
MISFVFVPIEMRMISFVCVPVNGTIPHVDVLVPIVALMSIIAVYVPVPVVLLLLRQLLVIGTHTLWYLPHVLWQIPVPIILRLGWRLATVRGLTMLAGFAPVHELLIVVLRSCNSNAAQEHGLPHALHSKYFVTTL